MARPPHHPALESDLAAALRRLVAVFGATQVTVTHSQPTRRPDPNPARSWQTTLLEEAPCTSTCT